MSSRRSPSTVETMCITFVNRSTSMSWVGTTLPATHTRPRSLRARSTSIACSACSFGSASSSCSSSRSRTSVSPARPRARDRPRRDAPLLDPHQGLGRGARELDAHHPQEEHVRRRVRDPEPPVDRVAAVGRGERHPPRRHPLEDVAGQDVLLERGDDLAVALVGHVRLAVEVRRRPCRHRRELGRRGALDALCERRRTAADALVVAPRPARARPAAGAASSGRRPPRGRSTSRPIGGTGADAGRAPGGRRAARPPRRRRTPSARRSARGGRAGAGPAAIGRSRSAPRRGAPVDRGDRQLASDVGDTQSVAIADDDGGRVARHERVAAPPLGSFDRFEQQPRTVAGEAGNRPTGVETSASSSAQTGTSGQLGRERVERLAVGTDLQSARVHLLMGTNDPGGFPGFAVSGGSGVRPSDARERRGVASPDARTSGQARVDMAAIVTVDAPVRQREPSADLSSTSRTDRHSSGSTCACSVSGHLSLTWPRCHRPMAASWRVSVKRFRMRAAATATALGVIAGAVALAVDRRHELREPAGSRARRERRRRARHGLRRGRRRRQARRRHRSRCRIAPRRWRPADRRHAVRRAVGEAGAASRGRGRARAARRLAPRSGRSRRSTRPTRPCRPSQASRQIPAPDLNAAGLGAGREPFQARAARHERRRRRRLLPADGERRVRDLRRRHGAKVEGPIFMSYLFEARPRAEALRTHDDGDPVVVFDEYADVWVISQFALNFNATEVRRVHRGVGTRATRRARGTRTSSTTRTRTC